MKGREDRLRRDPVHFALDEAVEDDVAETENTGVRQRVDEIGKRLSRGVGGGHGFGAYTKDRPISSFRRGR